MRMIIINTGDYLFWLDEEKKKILIKIDVKDIAMVRKDEREIHIVFRTNRAMIDFIAQKLKVFSNIEISDSLWNTITVLDRQWFVQNLQAYSDEAIPIGLDKEIGVTLNKEAQIQTCSQPSTVAEINSLLDLKPGMKGLEIGTGCGYHAHITAAQIYPGTLFTIERIKDLYNLSVEKHKEIVTLKNEYPKYRVILESKIKFIYGDGSKGYQKKAPYDFIYYTCGFEKPLNEREEKIFLKQLKKKGKLLYPLEKGPLQLIEKNGSRIKRKEIGAFGFVPLKGGVI